MIARACALRSGCNSRPHGENAGAAFEEMLPAIQRVAAYGFRHAPRSCRVELIATVVAEAYVAFAQLVARGQASLAYPTVLARYAIRRIGAGREFGCRQNVQDVLSPLAQRRKKFAVEPIKEINSRAEWEELLEDSRATPADIAACRIDFRRWLCELQEFKRRVALRLAAGDSTNEAAHHFQLSAARISQLRRELCDNWTAFQSVPVNA